MNTTQKGLLLLLKSAVTGEALPLPEDFSLEAADPVIRRQSLLPLAYQGAYNCGISPGTELMQQYQKQYFKILMHSQKQMRAVQQLYRVFEENGIDYMPLKGCNMKQMYPQPEMRMMGDADILIRIAQYSRIKSVMEQLGFEKGEENLYEFHWHRSDLHLELHKSLFSEDEKDLYDYYGDGWEQGVVQDAFYYRLRCEDEYVHLFAHMAKHYRKGGIGSRQILDLYVYRRVHPQMDETYIEQIIAGIGMLAFYRNTKKLLAVWFENGAPDETTECMTQYILSGGNWGTNKHFNIAAQVKRDAESEEIHFSQLRILWYAIFPTMEEMRFRHPALMKRPVLYPVFWLRRAWRLVFGRTGAMGRKIRQVEAISDKDVNNWKQQLQLVGLDFCEGTAHDEKYKN